MRKLPIGVQNFKGLINDGYVYVDKTEYIYRLVHSGKMYFLSRPRRFGKSLLLSTIRAYWEGKRAAFSGLKIDELEKDNPDAWASHPVFYFDFNGENYLDEHALEDIIDEHLRRFEKRYNISKPEGTIGERFRSLMIAANTQTGRRCVVLVDEYDKPLLDTIDNIALEERNKATIRGFFSSLKGYDEYIRFAFITGVTRFEKVSIFSDLNQLNDISLTEAYSSICGITDDELTDVFQPELDELATNAHIGGEDCRSRLKKRYDGYHFHPDGASVYNPFSLLKAFFEKDFGAYWFATGTPGFLIKKLRDTDFDIRKLTDRTLYASEAMLADYRVDDADPVPLLYQTGYLTIVDFDKPARVYTLALPNEEVKYGFLESLLPQYIPDSRVGTGTDIFTLSRYVENGNVDGIRDIFEAIFGSIPYTQARNPFEHYFQTVLYLIFTLLGKFAVCEMQTATGRIACVVQTQRYVYVFELKVDSTADEALNQIESKNYPLVFAADNRRLYKIGVAFDTKTRLMSDWKVRE